MLLTSIWEKKPVLEKTGSAANGMSERQLLEALEKNLRLGYLEYTGKTDKEGQPLFRTTKKGDEHVEQMILEHSENGTKQ